MNTYTVSVDSAGYSADYIDILIVAAENEEEADMLATLFIRDNHPLRTIEGVEVYPLAVGSARVIGRTINTDEEEV